MFRVIIILFSSLISTVILSAYASPKTYLCPNIEENIYYSIFSEVDEWQIYAVNLSNKPIYKFQTKTLNKEWSSYSIEITYDKKMSILFCATNTQNILRLDKQENLQVDGEIRALKFVNGSECVVDNIIQGFKCN